jgi:hypothetical protein
MRLCFFKNKFVEFKMDNIQTMNLSSDDSGMVPLEQNSNQKNIYNNNKETMNSATPLDEVLGLSDFGGAPLQQDPRMMPQHQAAMAPQMPYMQVATQQPSPPQQQNKNPFNLTDDQMESLFVGFVAVVAFSKPVQEKLAQFIPQFVNENGSQSTISMLISGIVAAILYYFGRRFVMRN